MKFDFCTGYKVWIAAALTLISGWAGVAFAQEESARMMVFSNFPFGWRTAEGSLNGIFVEIGQALAAESGRPIDFDLMPAIRLTKMLEENRVDLYLFAGAAGYPVPSIDVGDIGCLETLLVTAKQSNIMGLFSLEGKRVALTPGGWFDSTYRNSIDFYPVGINKPENKFRMLARGRIDAFVTDSVIFRAFVTNSPPRNLLPPEVLSGFGEVIKLRDVRIKLLVPVASHLVAEATKLSEALDRLQARGAISDIFERYGSLETTACLAE